MSLARKAFWGLVALVVLLLAAAAVFVATFDANRHRTTILAQLSQSINRPVDAADLELQLWPLRLRLNQVEVREAPDFAGQEFIRARAAQFDFRFRSLLRGEAEVQALELVEPTIYLRQDAAGRWNVATLGASPEAETSAERPAAETAPAPSPAPPVTNWLVQQGTLVVERAGQPPLRVTGVEFGVSELSPTRPFPFLLAVNFAPDSRLSVQGSLGPLDLAAPLRTPLNAEVSFENFRPVDLRSLVSVPPLLAQLGALEGKLKVRSAPEQLELNGALTLPGTKEQSPVGLELAARLPADFSRMELSESRIEHQGTRVSLSGSITWSPATAFDLQLKTSAADLAALRRLPPRLGLPAVGGKTLEGLAGKLTADLALKGKPEAWQLAGTAQLRDLLFPLEGFPQPLRIPALDLRIAPDRLEAQPFPLTFPPDLTLTVSGTVEDYRGAARLRARLTGDEVPVESLLALATRFGKNPLGPGQKLSGRVRPDVTLAGPLAEPAQLTYQGLLSFRQISLTLPPLPEPVGIEAASLSLTPTRLSAEPFTAEIGQKLRTQASFRLENYQTRPALEARVSTDNADLEALVALLRAMGTDPLPGGSARGRVTATLNLSGVLEEKAGPLAVSGQGQLASASLQPAGLTAPLAIEQARIEFNRRRLAVADLRLSAAGSTVRGSLEVEDFDAPTARFDFRGDVLDVEALQRLFGTAPVPPRRAARLSLPVVEAQEKSEDWFARLTARGRLAFDRVRHGTFALAPFAAPVAISKQVLTCDPIEFGLYDGGGRGRLVVDLRGAEPRTEFNGLLRNVDANKLLSENTDSKNRLYGRMGGTLRVAFAGRERRRMTGSARGEGQLTLVNGRLAHVNLRRELVLLGQIAGVSYQERDTPIEDMTTNFEISEGWVRTNDLALRTPDMTVDAVGGFSFNDELAFEATATFTPEASQRMTERSPLGRLTGNILTDDQGRVVIPFLVRGTFARPDFDLDMSRLLEMRLRRGRSRPAETLKEMLDRLRRPKKPSQ
ncbi:MAG: AsmA family protein [Acidobacteria bacterium]|nr:AsmA family protein [Acidobacteriota bacterium]